MHSGVAMQGTGRDATSDYLLIGLGFLMGAFLIAAGMWRGGSSADGSAIAVTTAVGALLLAAIAFRMSRTNRALIDPLTVFCVVVFAYFVVHAFWLLAQPPVRMAGFGFERPFRDALPIAQVWLGAGCVALLIGYLVGGRSHSGGAGILRLNLKHASTGVLVAVFMVGMAFQYLAYRSGGTYNAKNVLIYETFGYGAFTAYVVGVLKLQIAEEPERRRLRLLAHGFMFPVQALWALSHGSKTDLVVLVVAYLAVRQVSRRPVPARWIALGAALFVLVITPLVNQARSGRASQKTLIARSLIAGSVDALVHPPLPTFSALSNGFDLIQERTGGSESLALAVKYTPALRGYQEGRTLAAVPLGLVPHFIWPNKPYYSVGRDFSLIYAGQDPSQGAGLTVAPTIPGDLYMNFGPAGIVGGFFVIGLILRWISRIAEREHPSDLGVLVFITLLVQCLFLDQDMSVVMGGALTRVGAALLFAWVVHLLSGSPRREGVA